MIRALILACALALPAVAAAQDITVVGLDGKTKTLTAAQLADLPRGEVSRPYKGAVKRYEGPILGYILREAGAPGGAKMHGPVMMTYVLVRSADGFGAVLSLAEADKDFHDGVVILADTADGAKLAGKEGPYRLLVAGDKKGSRSVYGANRIELKTAQ